MAEHTLVESISATQRFFNRTTQIFDETDAAFRPMAGMYSVAEHIAHTAQTIDWFVDGAFAPGGMDMDFDAHQAEVRKVQSLQAARDWFARACARALNEAKCRPPDEFAHAIAGKIMGGEPRSAIYEAIADHTAHHRGTLAVYARLIGKIAPMPYM